MSKVITFGKVESYDPEERKLVAQWLPPAFTWKEGRVRTSGTRASQCDITTRKFDVTITPETAAKLVPDYVFSLEYDNSDPGSVKTVTLFAQQRIPPQTEALGSALSTSPSSPPPQ